MPHSFAKIWIHAIWSTKERLPLIETTAENKIYENMRTEFSDLGCPVRIINGIPDHVHCLFLLNPEKTVASIIKQIKGSTSHWINKTNLVREKFSWQTGYSAYSVSESAMEKVHRYIADQKQQHLMTSSLKEYEEFIRLHGLQNDK